MVTRLPSKESVERYSVVGEGSVELVTVFSVAKSSRRIIRCHSGLCNVHKGNQRCVDNLASSKHLCCHLIEYRNFLGVAEDDDDDNGHDDDEVLDGANQQYGLPIEKVIFV